MEITFDKRAKLIFGLICSVNKEYKIKSNSIDTIPSYCSEFYKLYKKYCSNELKEF